ncbi:tumor necrosis factor receptor superfamily member 6B [Paramormyrops kingsleyae]|uniref:Tumor necrosis factor receptor superfamily member 6B-like n=1 Tax=Paramormyrops kingsleyae TaxID=1676925 RepID=A0A3B3QV40_9TELE|nr:tumor necrosis factor receptor superfamily member 6B-like [Paramormyrops kingsleyae]
MLQLLQVMVIIGYGRYMAALVLTYEYREPASGRKLTCERCPPGTHMVQHCSATKRTQCAPCPPQHYTQEWNYLRRCLYCRQLCGDGQVVSEACSASQNTICQCKLGYFMQDDFCRQHTKCRPGYGVKVKGTAEVDTVCEKCPLGSYSPGGVSEVVCRNHTDCKSLRLQTVLKGGAWHDSLCASCDSLRAGGGLELLRGILLDFFSYHKMSKRKLERFVRQSLYPRKQHDSFQNARLQEYLTMWVKVAEVEKLKKLLKMLRRCDLHDAAEKLKKKHSKVTDMTLCDDSMN